MNLMLGFFAVTFSMTELVGIIVASAACIAAAAVIGKFLRNVARAINHANRSYRAARGDRSYRSAIRQLARMRLLFLTPFLVMAACAPTKYEATKVVAPVRQSITRAQEKVKSATNHATKAREATVKLEAALPPQTPELHDLALVVKTEIDGLTADLLETAEALRVSQARITEVEATASRLIAERDAAIKAKVDLARRYAKLKFALATFAAAAAGYFLFQFKSILAFAGPYAWAAFVVGPAAAFGLVWFGLDLIL